MDTTEVRVNIDSSGGNGVGGWHNVNHEKCDWLTASEEPASSAARLAFFCRFVTIQAEHTVPDISYDIQQRRTSPAGRRGTLPQRRRMHPILHKMGGNRCSHCPAIHPMHIQLSAQRAWEI